MSTKTANRIYQEKSNKPYEVYNILLQDFKNRQTNILNKYSPTIKYQKNTRKLKTIKVKQYYQNEEQRM